MRLQPLNRALLCASLLLLATTAAAQSEPDPELRRLLIEAIKTRPMRVPVVMRLVGTNEAEGRRIVQDAGLDVRWAADLDQAAEMAVEALAVEASA